MQAESAPVVQPAPSTRVAGHVKAAVALLALSHVVDDLYQGAVPALLPFWVAERGYSYAAATGITLAATFLSSLAQPAFGVLTDRFGLWWLAAVGMLVAGVGIGLSGVGGSYEWTWLAVALSGIGVAAYHPEAARAARRAAGRSAGGMSIFAVGGNVGFALAPVVVTPTMLALGTGATPLLVLPVLVMAPVLLILQPRLAARAAAAAPSGARAAPAERDDWRSFAWLTALVICRSILFFGLSSLVALYVIRQVGADTASGGVALTAFLAAGAVATLIGGWLADRHGRLVPIRLGYVLTVPALIAMLMAPTVPVALVCATVLGLAVYLPFSVQITLGQEYLPNRLGTASGVTLGLAVSAGGAFVPLLGLLADARGLPAALLALLALPFVALLFTTRLRDPSRAGRSSPTARPG